MSPVWLNQARGSFQRAASGIKLDIGNTDLTDKEACRILNDRIMRVRRTLGLLALLGNKGSQSNDLSFKCLSQVSERNSGPRIDPCGTPPNTFWSFLDLSVRHPFFHPRLSPPSSLPTCRPLRRPSVTSCSAEAPTLWRPSPSPLTWRISVSSLPWLPGTCRAVPTP